MDAMRILMDEHQSLAAIIHAIRHMIGEIGEGRLQLRQQWRAGLGVLCAVGGELQSATAALEQCGAEFGFERVDQLGDGLQRDALLARGGRQAAALCSREEVLNGLELVHCGGSFA